MVPCVLRKCLKLILIISSVLISPNVLCQSSDSMKCWSDKDKLKWSDFKGKRSENNEDNFLAARTAIATIPIASIKNGILDYQVKVVVRRYHSWTTDTTKRLLAHEQLHFDIAELSIRKLRKAIQCIRTAKQKPTEQDFDAVIEKSYLEHENMQDEYDQQTYHGVITDSQVEWQKKIFLELNKLKAYASTAADCR